MKETRQALKRYLGLSYYKKPPGDQWFDGYIYQKIIILKEFQSCFSCSKCKALANDRPNQTRKDHLPKTKNHRTKIKDNRPKTKDQRPETKDQRPKTKDQRPETKDQRPETRDQRPKSKVQRPETRDQSPKTKDQRPKPKTKPNKDQRPKTKDQRPKTKVQRSKTRDQRPETRHQRPNQIKTKDQRPNQRCGLVFGLVLFGLVSGLCLVWSLVLCHHELDFRVKAEWHFSATSHGKGVCDGIRGHL